MLLTLSTGPSDWGDDMNEQEIKTSLTNIRMWARGDQRAPHKPLLILYALGRILRGEPRMVQYGEARENLKILLSKPVRTPMRPDYSPKDTYLDWHFREVFRGSGRYLTG